jgi:hypothetical protein
MKTLTGILTATTALAFPALAEAKQITLTTEMANYGGDGAYLAYYVTDASGKYMGSLWMAGGKTRYYEHLSAWTRASGGDPAQVSGITGASVGQGQTLTLTLDLADSLFDAGYVLHVDAGVEHMRESADDVTIPLTSAGGTASGKTYIQTLSYKS